MASTAAGRPPAITEVELHGIEPVPDQDRTGQWEGPLRNVAEDLGISRLASVDISLAVAIGLAGVLSALFPEPRALHGPEGPRWFPASDAAIPPIEGRMRPAAGNPEADSPETGNTEVPVAGSSA